MRKDCKKHRYLLELLPIGTNGEDHVSQLIEELEKVQDMLGTIHDSYSYKYDPYGDKSTALITTEFTLRQKWSKPADKIRCVRKQMQKEEQKAAVSGYLESRFGTWNDETLRHLT